MTQQTVAVVGAGIVGLAHAWLAAERGCRVTVFERTAQASGASIRNFGMVWPIGQPLGKWHDVALRSRERWLQLADSARIWVNPCGSLHLAHRPDEWAVLQEFQTIASRAGVAYDLLTSDQIREIAPGANLEGLLGGLFSATELGVNPPAAVRTIPGWLAAKKSVDFKFQTAVTEIREGRLKTADGGEHQFDRAIVCGGDDLTTLFPEVLAKSGLKRCKLQMLKTRPQTGWRLGPHLASGLTLRHYANFAACPSLERVKQRIAHEMPELDRYGIHVMASQTNDACVILGDSHEYDSEIEPFDKALIDELMLRELRKVIHLTDWTIEARWNGVYAKYPPAPIFGAEPLPNVFVRTGTGGAGMTMSFGLAELDWELWA